MYKEHKPTATYAGKIQAPNIQPVHLITKVNHNYMDLISAAALPLAVAFCAFVLVASILS